MVEYEAMMGLQGQRRCPFVVILMMDFQHFFFVMVVEI
jgi:hypothetical protein